jgi:hypothetical protein
MFDAIGNAAANSRKGAWQTAPQGRNQPYAGNRNPSPIRSFIIHDGQLYMDFREPGE